MSEKHERIVVKRQEVKEELLFSYGSEGNSKGAI